MDANIYFLNQHLGTVEDGQRRADANAETAQEWINDESSEFYPWHPDQIRHAICEIKDEHLERLIKARADDKELAKALREIVVGFWLHQAEYHAEVRSID